MHSRAGSALERSCRKDSPGLPHSQFLALETDAARIPRPGSAIRRFEFKRLSWLEVTNCVVQHMLALSIPAPSKTQAICCFKTPIRVSAAGAKVSVQPIAGEVVESDPLYKTGEEAGSLVGSRCQAQVCAVGHFLASASLLFNFTEGI